MTGHLPVRDGNRLAHRLGGQEAELVGLQNETGHLTTEYGAGIYGDAIMADDRRFYRRRFCRRFNNGGKNRFGHLFYNYTKLNATCFRPAQRMVAATIHCTFPAGKNDKAKSYDMGTIQQDERRGIESDL